MEERTERRIILVLAIILILIGLTGCSKSIQNCSFNPSVTVESKAKDGETQKTESKIEESLNVKVSPKGEVSCNF